MTFSGLVRSRQSVRKYSKQPVEADKLGLCVEAVRLAPSASNGQPWRIIVVDEPGLCESVAKACVGPGSNFNRFAIQAPVLVAFVVEKSSAINQIGALIKSRDYPLLDIGIAAAHFSLQAAELGLGSCMMGWFAEGKIRKLLGVPATKRLALVISLGYPEVGDKLRTKVRKRVDAILGRNHY